MRLIDADELMQEIKSLRIVLNSKSIFNDNAKDTILRIIDEQPTAYDIDKVVKELKKLKYYRLSLGDAICDISENGASRHFVCLEDAIEIVKQGVR